MKRNPELEAAIIRAPNDYATYAVYSDWLIEQGDPRGELISLQRQQKKKEWQALLDANKEALLGPLVHDDLVMQVEWHMGWVKSAFVASSYERHDEGADYNGEEALRDFLAHPSTLFLEDMTVGILDFEGNGYSELFMLLAAHPKPLLRKLYVGAFNSEDTELNWSSIGTTTPLWAEGVVPSLENLTLRSGSMDLTGIRGPEMKELHLITGGLDNASLKSVMDAEWPKLEKLTLQLGREKTFEASELAALYEGKRFPALKHLAIQNTEISDSIAAEIVTSAVIKQLESLDLTLGTLGDEGAQSLLDSKESLKHLKRLDLSESWITKSMVARLSEAKLCEALFTMGQQDDRGDPNNRYISAYE